MANRLFAATCAAVVLVPCVLALANGPLTPEFPLAGKNLERVPADAAPPPPEPSAVTAAPALRVPEPPAGRTSAANDPLAGGDNAALNPSASPGPPVSKLARTARTHSGSGRSEFARRSPYGDRMADRLNRMQLRGGGGVDVGGRGWVGASWAPYSHGIGPAANSAGGN